MYNSAPIDLLLLAAGFGTRLRPLTEQIPKCLLPVRGVSLLDCHLHGLMNPKAGRLLVNTHHLADQVADHIGDHPESGRIEISHEPTILGTGGAIAHARHRLCTDPIAVVNADTLFAAPLPEAVAFHGQGDYLATMVLSDCDLHRNVFLREGRVTEIRRGQTSQDAFTFTGTHLLSQEAVSRLPIGVFCDIRDLYDALISEGRLGVFVASARHPLHDVGTPRTYLEAQRHCSGEGASLYGFPAELAPQPHPALRGYGYIDPQATVARDAHVADSVVLGNARIERGARVRRSIIGPQTRVTGEISDQLLIADRSVPL